MKDADCIITKKSIGLFVAVWFLSIGVVYLAVWRGIYSLDPLNLIYDSAPWNTVGYTKYGIYTSDTADALIPRVYNVYKNGESLFWNRYVGFGVAASPDVYLNPFNLVFLLPIKYAILVKSILKFSMAYFGMCFLLKQLKCRDLAAVTGAVSFAFSSAMVMWHFWHHTEVMMMAPWALLLGDRLIHKKRNLEMFWMAIVIYIMVVVGMPAYAAYVLYILGFYILINTIWEYRKDIKSIFGVYFRFAGAVIIGVIMSLPYVLYTFNTVVSNGYTEKRHSQATSTIELAGLRTFILPLYKEGLKHHLNETTVYVGAFAILMLLFAFIRFTKKKQLFWLISSFIIAILAYTHWLDFIFKKMPAVNSSLKSRVIAALCFTMSVLAAIQINDILDNKEEYKKLWFIRYPIYIANAALYIYIFMSYRDVTHQLRNIALLGMMILGLEIYILFSKKAVTMTACGVIAFACTLNMTMYIGEYLPYSDKDADIIPAATDTVAYMQDNLGDRRYIPVGGGWMLFPNSNVYYKLHNVISHDLHNTNVDIKTYMKAVDDTMFKTKTAMKPKDVDNSNLLMYAGVKYVAIRQSSPVEVPSSTLAHEGNDGVSLYELTGCADRVYLSSDVITFRKSESILEGMASEYVDNRVYVQECDYAGWDMESRPLAETEKVQVVSDSDTEILMNVSTDIQRILMFTDYYDGNWDVFIDGQRSKMFRANYLFNGVVVEPGNHEVRIVYNSSKLVKSIYITMAASILVVTAIIISSALCLKKKAKDNEAEESETKDNKTKENL